MTPAATSRTPAPSVTSARTPYRLAALASSTADGARHASGSHARFTSLHVPSARTPKNAPAPASAHPTQGVVFGRASAGGGGDGATTSARAPGATSTSSLQRSQATWWRRYFRALRARHRDDRGVWIGAAGVEREPDFGTSTRRASTTSRRRSGARRGRTRSRSASTRRRRRRRAAARDRTARSPISASMERARAARARTKAQRATARSRRARIRARRSAR